MLTNSHRKNGKLHQPRFFDWMVLWFGLAGCFVGGVSTVFGQDSQSSSQTFDRNAAEDFLKTHCTKCHNDEVREAELRLDDLAPEFTQLGSAAKWTEVMDRVNEGEMPPDSEPRPDAKQLQSFTTWIAEQLQAAAELSQSTGGKVVLRRLNRREYNNTVRDLLGVDFRPTDDFPEDPPAYGFDNVGSALSISPLHIEKYMAAAREVIDRAVPDGDQEPYAAKWKFDIDRAVGKGVWLTRRNRRGKEQKYAYMEVGVNAARDGHVVLRNVAFNRYVQIRKFQVHRPGRFVIRVKARSHVPGRDEISRHAMQLHDARHATMVADETTQAKQDRRRARWVESERARLVSHFATNRVYQYGPPRLRITVNARPLPVREIATTVSQVFEFPVFMKDLEMTLRINNDYMIPILPENFWLLKKDTFPRPELLIDWIEVEGPIYDKWPQTGERRFVDRTAGLSETARARKSISTFMSSAFRRPVRRNEVDAMMTLFHQAKKSKQNFKKALKVPMVAVLSSPSFLYLVEPKTESENAQLTDYELASRLSYFLWSSMPDNELYQRAIAGDLAQPKVLSEQVDRLLAHRRSNAFVDGFARQWLGLRELGAVEPDARLYPNYDVHLLKSMASESTQFFGQVLRDDLSVLSFLRSDFTTLNERLARFYGVKGVRGDHFRKVALGPDDHRGGVMRQASVHMVTSNGTRTSPVKRGVWILENILGNRPPPPPPNAGDIQPGVPGIDKATVRVRLEAHRKNAACAGCHAKIDPLGFALENYNAVGEWREYEGFGRNGLVRRDDPKIDTHGKLPDGRSLSGIDDLEEILLQDRRTFLKCLTVKLMTYALGRGIEYTDRKTVNHIVGRMPDHGYSLRGLIKDIVTSDAFLRK